MLVILGYLITILSVFGGFVLGGGHLSALFQPVELLMIGGASLGSFLVSNNWKIVKKTGKNIFVTLTSFGYSKAYYLELLTLLYEISDKIKKEGALSLEADIENPVESALFKRFPLVKKDSEIMEYLCDYLQFIVMGRVDKHNMDTLMDEDIETFTEEKEQCIQAINKVADGMPAFGIVAAVMGIVHTMGSLGVPPEQLGRMIAGALVGTFLGVLIGYGFVAPIGVLLEHRMNAAAKALFCVKMVLIATVNNFAPSIAVEFGRKIIFGGDRLNSRELESSLKEMKQAKSGTP